MDETEWRLFRGIARDTYSKYRPDDTTENLSPGWVTVPGRPTNPSKAETGFRNALTLVRKRSMGRRRPASFFIKKKIGVTVIKPKTLLRLAKKAGDTVFSPFLPYYYREYAY